LLRETNGGDDILPAGGLFAGPFMQFGDLRRQGLGKVGHLV
jgi:hypothetical protein